MQKWTREFISNAVHRALKKSEITRTTKLADDDMQLSMDSFDWALLWVNLESELGTAPDFDPFDPRDGLTNKPNVTPNIIIDFLYENLNADACVKQITKQKTSFFSRGTKEKY